MSRLVFATDLHLTEGQGGLAPFTTDLQEICALEPDLLVMGGDICLWEPGAGDELQRLLDPLPFPSLCVMGNHDTDRHGPEGDFDRGFVGRFGSRNGYVDLGNAHVLTLNTCCMQPEYDDWRNVRAEVRPDDLAWLDATLAGLERDRPLLLFVHIPLATTYPERRSADAATTDVWRVTNADAVLERLTAWPAPVVVGQGHLHENEHLHEGVVHLVSVGAVCGKWWKQAQTTRCPDDSPRGWLVVDVDADGVHLDYVAARSPEWRGEIVARTDGEKGDWLNLFFGDAAEVVEVLLDGIWQRLPTATPIAVDDTFFSVHHWPLPADFSGEAIEVRTRLRGQAIDLGLIHRSP